MCRKNYIYEKVTQLSFDNAKNTVTYALFKHGFGLFTQIDIENTLSNMGIDIGPYRVYGICNSKNTDKESSLGSSVGVLLPCNIVIRESNQNSIYVGILSPESVQALVKDIRIIEMINKVKRILEREFNQ